MNRYETNFLGGLVDAIAPEGNIGKIEMVDTLEGKTILRLSKRIDELEAGLVELKQFASPENLASINKILQGAE